MHPTIADVHELEREALVRDDLTVRETSRATGLLNGAFAVGSHRLDCRHRRGEIIIGPIRDAVLDVVGRFVNVDDGEVDVTFAARIVSLFDRAAVLVVAPCAEGTDPGGFESLTATGRSAAGKFGVDWFGRSEVLSGLPIRVLGTVAGRQHDGVALVVPTGESGRAGPTFTGAGNVQQVTGSTDQIVSSVCLDLGNPSLHDDVVCAVLLLELLDLR